MLGFVNGRSCAHKSKPRGLNNKKYSISGEIEYKGSIFFLDGQVDGRLVNICQHQNAVRQHLSTCWG